MRKWIDNNKTRGIKISSLQSRTPRTDIVITKNKKVGIKNPKKSIVRMQIKSMNAIAINWNIVFLSGNSYEILFGTTFQLCTIRIKLLINIQIVVNLGKNDSLLPATWAGIMKNHITIKRINIIICVSWRIFNFL